MMSYLGPDSMTLPAEVDENPPFAITPGLPEPLIVALIAKIRPGDHVAVRSDGVEGPWMDVYDHDGEGSVLWNPIDAEDEIGASYSDLYLRVTGDKATLKVRPR
jgi:hypothetical protein